MKLPPQTVEMIRARTLRPFPPTNEAEVAAFERRIGVGLPEDYRSFLLAHNGGWMEPPIALLNVVPEMQSDAQQDFFGLSADRRGGDLEWNLCLFDDTSPPIQVLALGGTIAGRFICLGLQDEDFGVVYYKDYAAWYRLADSFAEFLCLLSPDD